MIRKPNPDYLLYVLAGIATVIGLLAIWDAGYARAAVNGLVLPRELTMQAVFSIVAVSIGFAVGKVPAKTWKTIAMPGFVFSLILLFLVEVPFLGKEIGGARRWIDLKFVTIQPAEFAKLASILALAFLLSVRKPWLEPKVRSFGDRVDRVWIPKLMRGLYLLFPIGVAVLMIEMEPDLATAMVIAFTAFFMMILGGVTWKSIGTLTICGVALVGVLVTNQGYRMERITNHADRWSSQNLETIGYQTTQSEMAQAAGGLIGVGIGEGRAKHKLPAPTTDFIIATVGEEFGLIGSLIVIGILGFMVFRLMQLGLARSDQFGKLVICGVALWIGVQTTTNVMMANGYVPPIGIPLPFFSYGGSSLISLWAALGVCQSILSQPAASEKALVEVERSVGRARSKSQGVARIRSQGVAILR